ncbi:hypothetical protein ACLOJK_019997, partial [Asimina triloba]
QQEVAKEMPNLTTTTDEFFIYDGSHYRFVGPEGNQPLSAIVGSVEGEQQQWAMRWIFMPKMAIRWRYRKIARTM